MGARQCESASLLDAGPGNDRLWRFPAQIANGRRRERARLYSEPLNRLLRSRWQNVDRNLESAGSLERSLGDLRRQPDPCGPALRMHIANDCLGYTLNNRVHLAFLNFCLRS